MKENKYDNQSFFEKYSQMDRSQKGLSAAGEWSTFRKMLPDFCGKRLLDLGCGFGWHCEYAIEHGAVSATGIDISENMLAEARKNHHAENIDYQCLSIEDFDFPENAFDIVLSSLAFHYIRSFEEICQKVRRCLVPGGSFVFSVEHPVFTAEGSQAWHADQTGKATHWPVDRYFEEGPRQTVFLGENVIKYHKTLTTYLNNLLQQGFEIKEIKEPMPAPEMLDAIPAMKDELRRPMMLIVSATKK